MNVVIYARYSSHNQNEQSIEGQIAVCEEFAKRCDFNIIGEYIDRATSGTTDNRPEFLKMIKDSDKHLFQGVLVYQLDRFARNRYDSATYKAKLKKNGVRVFSARENISEDASGVLMESVLEGMAEYYSVELSQKVKRGMKINTENCIYNGGTIPLGLKLVDIDSGITDATGRIIKKKKFDIDEQTAPIVREIFELYANGYIMADIIKQLNEKGYRTATGGEFKQNSVRGILINKRYNGVYTCGTAEIADGIPKIIDDALFNKVQEIMKKNKKTPSRAKAKTEYLLTTKLFCGHCKDMMVGYSGTSKTGKLHTYYMCNKARKKLCNKKAVKKDYIEDLVVAEARAILTSENIKKISTKVVEIANAENDKTVIKNLYKELKDNEKQKNNLFSSLKICEIDAVKKSIFEEINKMEIEHQRIEKLIAIEESHNVILTVNEVRFFLTQLKRGNINDIKYRKLLINTLIHQVFLYDDSITILFNTQGKHFEKKIPRPEVIESSLLGPDALPFFCIIIWGCISTVEWQLQKLTMRVRFSSSPF